MMGSATGVMVLERGPDLWAGNAFLTWVLPALIRVAEPGLRGDREGVMAALLGIRQDVQAGEGPGGGFGGLAPEVDERLGAVITAFRQSVDGATVDRPCRLDVLAAMHNLGTLSPEEFAAGLELRGVAQVLAEVGAVQAVDPSKPTVDGSAAWAVSSPGETLVVITPVLRKAEVWAGWVRSQGRTVRSRRGKKAGGVQATALDVVHRVVFQNVPLQELDRELRVRKGTAAGVVKAALALYASLPIGA